MSDLVELFLLLGAILLVFGTAAWAGLRAAPWVPTRRRDIIRLLQLAELKPGETVYDLGSGDGRVLFLAAKDFQARAVGFEMSFLPYIVTRLRLIMSPYRKMIRLRWADFFHASLKDADVVFCFLTPSAMEKLRTKFVQELRPGARVVSYAFAMKTLDGVVRQKPDENTAAAYLYRR